MRFLLVAVLALAGCGGQRDGETISIYVPPPQQNELRPEYGGPAQTNSLGYLVESFALGASYGYANRGRGNTYIYENNRQVEQRRPTIVGPPVIQTPAPRLSNP